MFIIMWMPLFLCQGLGKALKLFLFKTSENLRFEGGKLLILISLWIHRQLNEKKVELLKVIKREHCHCCDELKCQTLFLSCKAPVYQGAFGNRFRKATVVEYFNVWLRWPTLQLLGGLTSLLS